VHDHHPACCSATGILVCILTTFLATDIQPPKDIADVEHTLKVQLIVSTFLMTPVSGEVSVMTPVHVVHLLCTFFMTPVRTRGPGCDAISDSVRGAGGRGNSKGFSAHSMRMHYLCWIDDDDGDDDVMQSTSPPSLLPFNTCTISCCVKCLALKCTAACTCMFAFDFVRRPQLAYAIAVTALPSEFTMMVPSSDPAHPFDVKTVKNWCALVYLAARQCACE
jgi:hypothetical protein